MKILFSCQSEGSGHFCQAVAVKQFLNKNGYDVSLCFAAKKKKELAKFFEDSFNLIKYDGLDFVFDSTGKMVIWKTALVNIIKFPYLIFSFIKLCKIIKEQKPDVIFNFYEPIVGLTAFFFPKVKYVSFGHQYAMSFDEYPKINGFFIQKAFLKILNYITSIRAYKVALSFYPIKNKEVLVSPPILREESYLKLNRSENFILVYLINREVVSDLISQAKIYPDKKIECFTYRGSSIVHNCNNLIIRDLDGKMFQEKMKVCSSVICSGGFETASEAIYHGKPLLMIPILNHFEQYSNCNDAATHGFANWNVKIDLSKIPHWQKDEKDWFSTWNLVLNQLISKIIEKK